MSESNSLNGLSEAGGCFPKIQFMFASLRFKTLGKKIKLKHTLTCVQAINNSPKFTLNHRTKGPWKESEMIKEISWFWKL